MKVDEFVVGLIIFIIGLVLAISINATLVGFMVGIGLSIMTYSYYEIKEKKK